MSNNENSIHSPALDSLNPNSNQSAESEDGMPQPRCPACRREMPRLLMIDKGITMTAMCPHEDCHTVISVAVDFMTLRMSQMQEMESGTPLDKGEGAGRIILPGGTNWGKKKGW